MPLEAFASREALSNVEEPLARLVPGFKTNVFVRGKNWSQVVLMGASGLRRRTPSD
jgi:hypothetical protein